MMAGVSPMRPMLISFAGLTKISQLGLEVGCLPLQTPLPLCPDPDHTISPNTKTNYFPFNIGEVCKECFAPAFLG